MTVPPDFRPFAKIPRLSRECFISEKIDGTNGCVWVAEDGTVVAGSRNHWLLTTDNYGFAAWVREHEEELRGLGPGLHFGEWWGQGIQRKYGQDRKRFSLFNTSRWTLTPGEPVGASLPPACCDVVPVLYHGMFDTFAVYNCLEDLEINGSRAAPGFMQPEGVVVYHVAAGAYFKKTIEHDDAPKSAKGAT